VADEIVETTSNKNWSGAARGMYDASGWPGQHNVGELGGSNGARGRAPSGRDHIVKSAETM
jgi:hypothetical protein